MKNHFTKTILTFLTISMITVFNGFCIFQLSASNFIGAGIARASAIDNITDAYSNNPDSCGEEQPVENSSKQTPTTPVNHSPNPPLACCINDSHNGVVSIIQAIESGLSIPVSFFPQYHQIEIPSPRMAYGGSPSISPPALDLIKTVALRL